MLTYREATVEDINALVFLSISLTDESQYNGLFIDIEDIKETLRHFITSPISTTVTYVAESDAGILGFIVGTASKLPFSKEWQASETLWYVYPEFRNTDIGKQLYKLFTDWAINNIDAKVIHTASPYGSKLGKAYEKEGYKMFEELYIKVLD